MKKIALRAEEHLLDQAQHVAKMRGRTLDEAFRGWLVRFTVPYRRAEKAGLLMKKLRYIRSSGPYTRREMNEQ
jgi:hypothetical protein